MNKGFTLIELLVAIIGILAVFIFNAKKNTLQTNFKNLEKNICFSGK